VDVFDYPNICKNLLSMISKLSIKNFQSHKDSILEFDKGVNIIIGPSDSGKTAIIRALRWLFWNRPQGDSVRSNWGGETVVHIETDTDKIDRWKHNYENAYRLNTQTDFKALRSDVPQEIIDALNISEINLQRQLDSPFLLSETPGVVAQHFNKVAKLDKIDTATSNINSAIRQLTSDIKYGEEQKEKIEEELKSFEHLEKFEADVEVLEDMEKGFDTLVSNRRKIQVLVAKIGFVKQDIDKYSQLLLLEQPLNKIFDLREQLGEVYNNRKALWSLVSSIKLTNDEIDHQNTLTTLETPVNSLLSLYKQVNTLKSDKIKLSKAISYINSTKYKLSTAESLKMTLEAKFDEEFPDVCPLCGSKMK